MARSKLEHGQYILIMKYRVSQTHRGASQYKKFRSGDVRWTAGGRASENVLASLQVTNLPLLTVRKFARKTREYLRAYKADAAETESYWLVEKLRRTFKCHRSSLDFDFKFIRDA